MIRRIYYFDILAALFVVGSVVLSTSDAAAEPIMDDSSFDVPDNTVQKQDPTNALALFKARDFEGSLKLWREAVKKNPDFPPAQTIMAQLYLQANMPQEARKALEQAIVETPTDPEAYLFLNRFCLSERNLDKAESFLRKAESLLAMFEPNKNRKTSLQIMLLGDQATLAQARKDWAGSQQSLESLLKLDPKNIRALQQIAYCLFQQKKMEDSLEKLREIAIIDPTAPAPEAVLSKFYDQAGDRQNADQWMASAVAAAPKNLKTRLLAAHQALGAGQLEEARKQVIAATQLDQKSMDAQMLQAMIAMYEKNYLTAELLYEAALKQSPNNWGICNNLAMVLIEQNDETKGLRALEYAEANVKRLPQSPQAATTYGYVLYRLKRLDDAEKSLRVAASIASTDPETAYILARVAADRGRKDEARRLLETGLKSTQPSMFRQESEDLLQELKK